MEGVAEDPVIYVMSEMSFSTPFFRARGKRKGFRPGAAARHSQHARAYTDSHRKQKKSQGPQHVSQIFPIPSKQPILSSPRIPTLACSDREPSSPYRPVWEIWEMTE